MLSLIDPTTVPPGGFRYVQKETNATITAPSLPELLVKVRDHRMANQLPLRLEWKSEIEDALCFNMPPGVCRHLLGVRDIALAPAQRTLALAEVLSGVKTLGAWMFNGFQKVDQATADDRSRTCAACPFNQPSDGCTTCASNALREAVTAVLGRSQSAAHESLKTCGICGCSLKVAVWCPTELIIKHKPESTKAQSPEWCWAK